MKVNLRPFQSARSEPVNDTISVIIPALNEASNIPQCVPKSAKGLEVIIADGGSTDSTVAVALANGCKVARASAGRASQMNAGAAVASGSVLLFLHADTRLPECWRQEVLDVLAQPRVVAGAFRLGIDENGWGLRIIERLANWRSTFLQMPYGDQALFLRAERFRSMGGFPDLPIMEDFELVRRLQKKGAIRISDLSVETSARRWKRLGLLRTTLINFSCVLGYRLGVDPWRIRDWYYRRREPHR